MKTKNKNFILNTIAWTLIISSLISLYYMYTEGSIVDVFWLSNHIGFVLGIAILARSTFWITAELCLGFIGEIGWTLDFLIKKIFNTYLFGSTAYLFAPTFPKTLYWASMTHLIIIPIAILALYLIRKPEPTAWKGALFHGTFLIITGLTIAPQYNINCIQASCVTWIPTFPGYVLIWSAIYFAIIFLLNQLIVKYIQKHKNR